MTGRGEGGEARVGGRGRWAFSRQRSSHSKPNRHLVRCVALLVPLERPVCLHLQQLLSESHAHHTIHMNYFVRDPKFLCCTGGGVGWGVWGRGPEPAAGGVGGPPNYPARDKQGHRRGLVAWALGAVLVFFSTPAAIGRADFDARLRHYLNCSIFEISPGANSLLDKAIDIWSILLDNRAASI